MMSAWAKEPIQEAMRRVLPRVSQTESLLFSLRASERNSRATTTPQIATIRQIFGDFARRPAHSHPKMENIPRPMTMTTIHKELTIRHVKGL